MKICGIICEYNPFHNGHLYHIQQAKKITNCDILVVILSGNYVQRGDISILSKWDKTKLALDFGCDLVIELPSFLAVQSAEYFAKYAMQLLHLANVDCFVFGSESNDLNQLIKLSNQDMTFLEKNQGDSLVKSYQNLLGRLHSNDILGINYLKYRQNIQPYTILRTNHYFDTTLSPIASASAIRNAIFNNQDVSIAIPYSFSFTKKSLVDYYPIIQNKLITFSIEELQTIFLMDEGIESLFKKAAKISTTLDEFLHYTTSKRYTSSRIQRTLVHLLLNNKKTTLNHLPDINYIRVLGFNSTGQAYLKTLSCNVATNINQIPEPFRSLELTASYIYYGHLPKIEIEKPIIK